jgi:hypothetical protein
VTRELQPRAGGKRGVQWTRRCSGCPTPTATRPSPNWASTFRRLEDRTGRALRARVGSDLDELLADLPRRPQAPARPQPPARPRPALLPFLVPVLVAAGLTATVLTAAAGGGWHHQWAFGWALWWVVPVMAMRMLWWRRFGGARPWR